MKEGGATMSVVRGNRWFNGVLVVAALLAMSRGTLAQQPPVMKSLDSEVNVLKYLRERSWRGDVNSVRGVTAFSLPGEDMQWDINEEVWEWIAQTKCPKVSWQPDFTSPAAYAASVEPLRRQLQARVGPIPPAAAGSVLSRTTLYTSDRYTVEWVEIASRLTGVSVFGFLARPSGVSGPAPAVVALTSDGVPINDLLGWTLPNDAPQRSYPSSPLSGVAVDLVESGYVVFVPWLDDDRSLAPELDWLEVDRWGAILAMKAGSGGGYGILVPQVMAVVDFLSSEPAADPHSITLLGWGTGAQVAGVTAALDDRVAGLIWIRPPLDTKGLRSDPFLWPNAAPFEMMDCSFGQREIAALVFPRPILFSYTPADPYWQWLAPYVSDEVYVDIAASYMALGFADNVSRIQSAEVKSAGSTQPLAWLARLFAYRPRPLPGGDYQPPVPIDFPYPSSSFDQVRSEIASYLASLGTCHPVAVQPDFSSLNAFQESVVPLRQQVESALGGPLPPERPIAILTRQTVVNDPDYLLEWVRFQARFNSIEVAGYLATPKDATEKHPAILSLDGNFVLGWPFGLYSPITNYLNDYGDYLARSGYVVFAPYMPSTFADGWGASLSALSGGTKNFWSFTLPVYMSGVDFLRSLDSVDPARVGVAGVSYAGVAAMLTAALDQRINLLLYADPTIDMAVRYSTPASAASPIWMTVSCQIFEPTQRLLVAPRAFVWQNGILDQNQDQTVPLESVIATQSTYMRLGESQWFDFVPHNGGHEMRPDLFHLFYYNVPPGHVVRRVLRRAP
jgi:dienelactone hydrolase